MDLKDILCIIGLSISYIGGNYHNRVIFSIMNCQVSISVLLCEGSHPYCCEHAIENKCRKACLRVSDHIALRAVWPNILIFIHSARVPQSLHLGLSSLGLRLCCVNQLMHNLYRPYCAQHYYLTGMCCITIYRGSRSLKLESN